MELKVWVEGIQRIVCGVTENTSCQDVVYALAAATGKTGRFTLIERWRNNERLLSPNENPLKLLTKYGEYSNDVQFILQRSATSSNLRQKTPDSLNGFIPATSPSAASPPTTPDRNRDIRKSLTFSGGSRLEVRDDKALREAPPYREPPRPISPLPQSQRTLPPYRAPPPPGSSPNRATPPVDVVSPTAKAKPKRSLQKDFQHVENNDGPHEGQMFTAQYRDLIRLVTYQREKLSSQQSDLVNFDSELVFWEAKAREHQQQMEYISQEVQHVEAVSRIGEEQLRSLANVEEESEIVRQQEKTLKSELTLLRSKLANCETELLQCKNKIRLIVDEVTSEQRAMTRESEDRQSMERSLLGEVDRLQREVEQARQSSEMSSQCGESLKREVNSLEMAISDKKKQVERLVSDMKEANLQSLAIAPPDELKHFLEGPHKPGSTRKMIGSPRQLENAVPTSKNPHGVWV